MKQAVYDESLGSSNYVKWYPKLDNHFGARNISLIIGELENWFKKQNFKNGFYKFLEPCNHNRYKEGDSWEEVIGISRHTFRKLFRIIGHYYSTKTAYLDALEKAEDPFHGKMYVSYFDRVKKMTFYIRNHRYVDQFFTSFFAKKLKQAKDYFSSDKVEKYNENDPSIIPSTAVNNDPSNINKIQLVTINSSKADRKNNTKKLLSEYKSPAVEMVQIWEEEVGQTLNQSLSSTLITNLETSFREKLGQNMENWRQYCRKIASSKFLMGEVTKFRAWITWASKPEAIEKIENGAYSLGDRKSDSKKFKHDLTNEVLKHIANQPTHHAQTFHQCLYDWLGLHNYYNWIKDLQIADIQSDKIIFMVKSGLFKSEIDKRFRTEVAQAVQYCFSETKSYELKSLDYAQAA